MRALLLAWLATACAPQDEKDCVNEFYADADGDGHGVPEASVTGCIAPTGYETTHDDCDDRNSAIHPGADELCNGIDDNCDGAVDPFSPWYVDSDGDGYGTGDRASCDTPTDSAAPVAGDCNDGDAAVHPDADEICNGVDDDCDGAVDVDAIDAAISYTDADGDGYGNDATESASCDGVPAGSVATGGDCDDDVVVVHPGAAEVCDEIDDDCDTLVDFDDPDFHGKTQYADADEDGFGDPTTATNSCTAIPGWVTIELDCDDTASTVNPDVEETCNGIDDDCDGLTDDDDPSVTAVNVVYYLDEDGDGAGGSAVSVASCVAPAGYLTTDGDCDDALASTHPGAVDLWGNDVDDDCDGLVDDYQVDDADLSIAGVDAESYVGWQVAQGDLNADGVADVVAATPALADASVWVVFGPRSGALTTDDADLSFAAWSNSSDASLGQPVSADDANGDGDDDLLIAASETNDAAYLFLGPLTSSGDAASADAAFQTSDTSYGMGVARILPDFDGDEIPDVAVSTLASSIREPGSVFVVSGATSGTVDLETDATWTYTHAGGRDSLGGSLVAISDATGDGTADLAMGSPGADSHRVFVVSGDGDPGTYGIRRGITSLSSTYNDGFGEALDSADYDGDGYGDLFVGAPFGSSGGAVYAFLGPFGDDRDTGDAEAVWRGEYTFGLSVAAGGDVDGDGEPDVLLGTLSASDAAGDWKSAVYVQPGSTSGTAVIRDVTKLASFRPTGDEWLGYSAAFLPDWTGDGCSEILLGQPGYTADTSQGRVDVVFSETRY